MGEQLTSTGTLELDQIIGGLNPGDNIIFKVESVDDYHLFVDPFLASAAAENRPINYMRFGDHLPLLQENATVEMHLLDPRMGFEFFTRSVYNIVKEKGTGALYVFDCLSELVSAWATDHMIGNFFEATYPYLKEFETISYFTLMRDHHSFVTIERLRAATSILIDSFSHTGGFFIQPLKVNCRQTTTTTFLPHIKQGNSFMPLLNSIDTTRLYHSLARRTRHAASRQVDHWHRIFTAAEKVLDDESLSKDRRTVILELCQHMIAREGPMLRLAEQYFSLEDLLEIKSRMIGTGFIGGKAAGMLLAQNILRSDRSFDWRQHLENHDSHYIASNTYYTYIVYNGLWPLYMQQKTAESYFTAAAELRERMLTGTFPAIIREGFRKIVDYFGTFPIIIRSSSMLEDSFGNAFAGKYESIFCVNQGTAEQRLEQLEQLVRRIYASTMSEDALSYRMQRVLDQQDEQMALLVQRVSGAYRRHYYFPELAGVGVSYNTFVWESGMDPRAGMLRLVIGLGTRAVGRAEGDYSRVVALDAPERRPHHGNEDMRRFSQHDVDVLNVAENRLETVPLSRLTAEDVGIDWQRYAVRDRDTMRRLEQRGRAVGRDLWLLTFDEFLRKTEFTALLQRLLKKLEDAYCCPVDVEFTANFTPERTVMFDVVQCRPLQTRGAQERVELPDEIAAEKLFFRSAGHFMGGNLAQLIDWVIWVDAATYPQLSTQEKYEVSRVVGDLNRQLSKHRDNRIMLLGPGRWGTSTPALGVPISFSRISNLTALVEVAFPAGNLVPELSYGSHFFQDLVEAGIFYLALFPDSPGCYLNLSWLEQQDNRLMDIAPENARLCSAIKVVNSSSSRLQLLADVVAQQLVCFAG